MAAEADPEDLASPSLAQVLDVALDGALAKVHTCSWGYVTSYDAATQRANVQIAPRRAWTDEEGARQTERPAPLISVPIIFPGSGPYSITWNIASGDWVLLLFAETAMDSWHEGGQTDVDSGDRRHHALSDAVGIPGLRPRTAPITSPPTNALVITAPNEVRLVDKDVKKRLATADDIAILRAVIQSVTSTSDIVFAAAVLAAQTALALQLDDATTYSASGLSDTSPHYPAGALKVKGR